MRYWCYAGGKRSVKSAWNGFRYMQTSIWRTNRRAEEAERELAELKAESNARAEVMRRLTGSENADIDALAESIGTSADDLLATMDSEKAVAMKDLEIKRLCTI